MNARQDNGFSNGIAIWREGDLAGDALIAAVLSKSGKILSQSGAAWPDTSSGVGEQHRGVVSESGVAVGSDTVPLSKTLNELTRLGTSVFGSEGRSHQE